MRRVVKSSFQAGNIGGANCGVSEGLVLVCAEGEGGLHSLDLGEQGGWDIRVIRIDADVARFNTGTGKVEEVERGVGVRAGTERARPTARSTTWRYRSPLRVGLSVIPWGEERGRDSMGFV